MASKADIQAAYKDVLGRDADATGLESYSGFSIIALRKSLGSSTEAGDRKTAKLDETPATNIAEKDQPYVALWQEKHKGQTLGMGTYKNEIRYWRNLTNENVAGYDAYLRGEIHEQKLSAQTGHSNYTVSQQAIDRMGGKIDLRANTTGQGFKVPEGAEWAVSQGRREKVGSQSGADFYGVGTAETKGLFGGVKEFDTVVNKWLPKEVVAMADTMYGGIPGNILGGSKQAKRRRSTVSDVTGLKESEVAVAESISDSITKVAITAIGSPAAAAAYSALSGAGRMSTGEGNFREAAIDTALAYASTPRGTDASYLTGASRTLAKGNRVGATVIEGGVNIGAQSLAGRDVDMQIAGVSMAAAGINASGKFKHPGIVGGVRGAAIQVSKNGNASSILLATAGGAAAGTATNAVMRTAINEVSMAAAGIVDRNPPGYAPQAPSTPRRVTRGGGSTSRTPNGGVVRRTTPALS